ncbi:MAG: methyltransferase domain-containing protein, partial [Gemmatimonadota bacterium]
LHHGLWRTGRETPAAAALALVDEVLDRAAVAVGASVCDVGCGYGAVTRVLSERGMVATGLTVSRAQYQYACHPPGGADRGGEGGHAAPRFLLRDWLENGLPDAAFDAVVAIESLSHRADPARAIREAARVLKPGGRLVACVWMAGAAPRPWEVRHILRPICDEGRLPGLPSAEDHIGWARDAGLVDVDLEDVSGRVARTWSVCARRLLWALLRPSSWRYLADRRKTERAFALTVLRLLAGYRTGAVRYGILRAVKAPAGTSAPGPTY